MSYRLWLNSIMEQIDEWESGKETDLILLKNHLGLLLVDIENDPEYKRQLRKCTSK